MNSKQIQTIIDEIILDVRVRGWKANKTTKKALARIDELGLTSYIPEWMTRHGEKADIYINEIIKQAEQAGKTVTHSILEEDGHSWEEVTPASALYQAFNQTEPLYKVTSTLISGTHETVTRDQLQELVDGMEFYGWIIGVYFKINEVVLYAMRLSSETITPDQSVDWEMCNSDVFEIIIAEAI